MTKLRRTLAALGMAGAAAATMFTTAPAAQAASGGGCGNWPSWEVRACISVVSNGSVVADGYLSAPVRGCARISVALIDPNGSTLRSTQISCRTGFLAAVGEPAVGGRTYYSRIRVWNSSNTILSESTSPPQYT